jgi:predicted DNA-binding transcriptional regulator AlpA
MVAFVPLWSRPTLCRELDISRVTSYRMEAAGLLPTPIQITPGKKVWRSDEVLASLESRRCAPKNNGAADRGAKV